jgi:hypothetical protein
MPSLWTSASTRGPLSIIVTVGEAFLARHRELVRVVDVDRVEDVLPGRRGEVGEVATDTTTTRSAVPRAFTLPSSVHFISVAASMIALLVPLVVIGLV